MGRYIFFSGTAIYLLNCILDLNIGCVTMMPRFQKMMDQDVLELTLFCYFDTARIIHESPPGNRSFRYAAYRVAAWFIFGRLGSKRRQRLPHCLVKWIRDKFPEADGDYTGFIDVNGQSGQ